MLAQHHIKHMTDEDLNEALCNLVWVAHSSPRHLDAVLMIARQLAFAEAGSIWQDYFRLHRQRLMAEAARIIAARPGLARWR